MRLALGAGVAVGAVLVHGGARVRTSAPAQDPPTFRAEASAIAVDVNVKNRSGRPLTGLSAVDFEVYDSGVRQRVDEVTYGRLPIDVTVALDVSHSVTGRLLERLRDATVALMRDLSREDRLKLILFNMRVARTIDFTDDVKSVERAIQTAAAGGGTALLDAISVALVSASAPDRRQLIVFFTDGSDSVSTTTPAVVTRTAQRTRATLTFVMPGVVPQAVAGRGSVTITGIPGARVTLSPQHAMVSSLAAETGGTLLPVGSTSSLSDAFRGVLNEFRATYVLYYRPTGVDRAGYHPISVKVNREGAQVQARRGYFGS